jgi:hypothetical protein
MYLCNAGTKNNKLNLCSTYYLLEEYHPPYAQTNPQLLHTRQKLPNLADGITGREQPARPPRNFLKLTDFNNAR